MHHEMFLFAFQELLVLKCFCSVCSLRLFGSNRWEFWALSLIQAFKWVGGIMFPFNGVFVCLFFPYIFSGQGEEYGIIM